MIDRGISRCHYDRMRFFYPVTAFEDEIAIDRALVDENGVFARLQRWVKLLKNLGLTAAGFVGQV